MRKFLNSILAIAASALLALSMSAFAQSSGANTSGKASNDQDQASRSNAQPGSNTSGMANMSSTDRDFLTKAAEGGKAEVELGNLATQKASSNDVKQFAQRMVEDHGKANKELEKVAKDKGIALPDQPDAKDKAEKSRLEKLSGAQFDKAYMAYMVKDHTKDVSEFRKESQSAKDSDVKNFAAKTLPTLEDHLKQAQSVDSKVSSASKKNSSDQQTAQNTNKSKSY